jgi:hypothetical protein
MAYKAEHAVDMETGAVVAVTVQTADTGDTHGVEQTLVQAVEHIEAVAEVLNQAAGSEVIRTAGPVE